MRSSSEVDPIAQLRQEAPRAAGMMEMLHVMVAEGFKSIRTGTDCRTVAGGCRRLSADPDSVLQADEGCDFDFMINRDVIDYNRT